MNCYSEESFFFFFFFFFLCLECRGELKGLTILNFDLYNQVITNK